MELGQAYALIGLLEKAINHFEGAIHILLKVLGDDHQRTVQSYWTLGLANFGMKES